MSDKEPILYIEKVKLDKSGHFLSSDCIKATINQIKEFKSKKCNHTDEVDTLIYDKDDSWPYASRYCGVCNEFITLL